MGFDWTDDHCILFNYGNDFRLSATDTRSGGPGYAVGQHEAASRRFRPRHQLDMLDSAAVAGYRAGPAKASKATHPIRAFAWGWWAKGWESHPDLLAAMERYLEDHESINAYLYSSKEPEMFRVRVLGVHWVHGADYVGVPDSWRDACPEYYRHNPALCRAFFLIDADNMEATAPDREFEGLVVSPVTFAEIPDALPPGGEMPHPSVRRFFDIQSMSKPERASLRATEKTLWVVQRCAPVGAWVKSALDEGEELGRTDEIVSLEIPARSKIEALSALCSVGGPRAWARFQHLPLTLEAIFELDGDERDPLFRADVELASRWLGASVDQSFGTLTGQIEQSIVNWALEIDYEKKLRLAQQIYQLSWRAFCERYKIPDDKALDKYVAHLTDFEKLFAVAKHGLVSSMYRDHLNHNVRSALLAPRILELLDSGGGDVVSDTQAVGFFAGLLHDIAYVVSESEDVLAKIRTAIDALTVCAAGNAGTTRLNQSVLKSALLFVLVLSSTKNIHEADATSVTPWNISSSENAAALNHDVFRDVSVAAGANAHSLLGAVALFALAAGVNANQLEGEIEKAFADLFERLSNPQELREVLQIVQAVALHDRKEAAKYAGLVDKRAEIPAAVSLEEFPLAVSLIVADELQDWGRPVGAPSGHIFSDFRVKGNRADGLEVEYTLSPVGEFYEGTPYSLLEHIIGKMIAVSRVTSAGTERLISRITVHTRGALRCEFVPAPRRRSVVSDVTYWLSGTLDAGGIRGGAESPDTRMAETETLIVLRIAGQKGRDVIHYCDVRGMGDTGHWDVDSVVFENTSLTIQSSQGVLILTDLTYVRGTAESNVADVSLGEHISLLSAKRGALTPAVPSAIHRDPVELAILEAPDPHFLDLDWRFAPYSARKVVELIDENVDGIANGTSRVCYLGCPTLAVAHAALLGAGAGDAVALRDLGHLGIEHWVARHNIPRQWFSSYDVAAAVDSLDAQAFDVVIMDPPWYRDHYSLFLRRGRELLSKQGGLIGIAQYPGYSQTPRGKVSKKQQMVELEEHYLQGGRPVFALTVYYAVPLFEAKIDESQEFRSLSGYRPTKMVFYKFESNVKRPTVKKATIKVYGLESMLVGRGDSDIVFKVRSDLVRPKREGQIWEAHAGYYDSLRRPEEAFLSHVLAWSNDNLVLTDAPFAFDGYTPLGEFPLTSDRDIQSQLAHFSHKFTDGEGIPESEG